MTFSDYRVIKLIATITIVLALLQPTTAGFGDLLSSVVNTCHYSECENHPRCPGGYDSLTQTREGCSGFKEKSYCCASGTGPQCFFSGCDSASSCPGNYRQLDTTRNGCSGFKVKAYCCKTSNLPHCFDLSCPAFSESAKSCPPEYSESRRVKGRSGGCDSAFAERVTCCLRGSGGNQFGSTNNNTQVITETKTEVLEDGSVRTVTKSKSTTTSTGGLFNLFGSGESSYQSFFKVLLMLPILIAML